MKAGDPSPALFEGEPNSKMSSAASVAISEEQDERYYRIGEVSRITEVRPFVLRYWEEEFPMLEPVKGRQGYRLYRQQDVDLVLKIKRLLYDEGFTIAGARRHLRDPLQQQEPAFALPLASTRGIGEDDDRGAGGCGDVGRP